MLTTFVLVLMLAAACGLFALFAVFRPSSIMFGPDAGAGDLTTPYASGYWTPTASAISAGGTVTPSGFRYTRVGRVITAVGKLTLDASASAMTSFKLSLPAGITGSDGAGVVVACSVPGATGAASGVAVIVSNALVSVDASDKTLLDVVFPAAIASGTAAFSAVCTFTIIMAEEAE